MSYFDALLSIGRTNGAVADCPTSEAEALAVMDRYGVDEALVFHTLSRDGDPASGNAALCRLVNNPRLHRIFAYDPALPHPQATQDFLDAALHQGAKAVLVNPAARGIVVSRSPRLAELAALLEPRRIPLYLVYRQWNRVEEYIDWDDVADFCMKFPKLPVFFWQWRSRNNRPMFDAMAQAKNLSAILSTIWQAQMVEGICDTLGPGRVVFSLGLPELHASSFPAMVAYANLSAEVREAVAGGTMRALLAEADYAC